MTKPNDKNDDRYKTLGFESAFDGTATGIQWSELVEGLKTNVLRTTRAAKPAAMGLLGQSGALSVSGTACRPRRDPPGVPRGYRGSGPMVSGV